MTWPINARSFEATQTCDVVHEGTCFPSALGHPEMIFCRLEFSIVRDTEAETVRKFWSALSYCFRQPLNGPPKEKSYMQQVFSTLVKHTELWATCIREVSITFVREQHSYVVDNGLAIKLSCMAWFS